MTHGISLLPYVPNSATPLRAQETNSQAIAKQLTLAISLYRLPWLSLAQRMKSLEEEKMKRTLGQAAIKHSPQRWEGALESWDPRQQPEEVNNFNNPRLEEKMYALGHRESNSRCYSCLVILLNLCTQGLRMWSRGKKRVESLCFRSRQGRPVCSLPGDQLHQLLRATLSSHLSNVCLQGLWKAQPHQCSCCSFLCIIQSCRFTTSSIIPSLSFTAFPSDGGNELVFVRV